jgi:tetratricopeptide (TPR) repeat protein
MLEQLENRLGLLKSGARDLPERQRTLRQTIDWSFKLLSDDEQRLFCRMAVFSGGCTIDAIEAVCAPGLSFDVLDGTESLLNKSLLFQKEGPAGEPRFLMLETIHEYARERLIESGEEEELRDRHLLYFCSLAEEMEPGYRKQNQLLLFERTEAEWSNFQRSFNWALENRQFQNAACLVSSLDYFLRYKERVVEGHRWVRRLLLDLEHVPIERRARLMLTASRLELVSGEVAQVNRFALDAMEYAQETGDRQSEAYALLHISIIASLSDRYAEAMKWIEEAEVIFRALGDRPALAETFNARGEVARVAEDFETAHLAYEKAFEICRETGEILRTYMIMANLSFIAYNKGDFHLAKKLSVDTLNGWLEIGVRQGIISALWILAGPLSELSEPRKAALLLGAAQASFAEMGAADHPSDLPQVAEYMARTQAMIGSDEFKKAWDEGQAMSLEQAVAYALED